SQTWDVPEASEQFLGLCACELWRRWCPEPPSLEMIDDLFQQGYSHLRRLGEETVACVLLLEAWEQLCLRLPDDIDDLRRARNTGFLQDLDNCLLDTLELAHNAALRHVEIAKRGLACCQQVRKRFPHKRVLLSEYEAHFLFILGQEEQGEALLRAVMAEDPDLAMPYV